MATAKNKCTIVLTDRKCDYTFDVSEQYLEEFLNDNLDIILGNEVTTHVNMLKITTTREGVVINSGITKKLFSYIKNMLLLNESNTQSNKTQG